MFHNLTKAEKRALREAAQRAHQLDREMSREDRDVHYLEARNQDLPFVVSGAVARGLISIEDVGEAARELVADLARSLQAVRDSLPARSEPNEDETVAYDPAAPLSIGAILNEIDAITNDSSLYVNRTTGEVRVIEHEYISDDDANDLDDEDDPDEPQWRLDAMAEGREMAANADWERLLGRLDIDDYDIMRRFARNAGPAASRDLEDALHGRGRYRRFRDVIHRRGLQKEWIAFRSERLSRDVRSMLESRGIRFRE